MKTKETPKESRCFALPSNDLLCRPSVIEPFYQDAQVTIYHGDCGEILPQLADESVDCVITDPPYNIGYKYENYDDAMPEDDYFIWQLGIIEEAERIMRRNSSLLYLHYPEFAARMFWAVPEVCDLAQQEWLTWIYNTHTGGTPLRKASRAWLWFSKEIAKINAEALQGEYKNPTDKRVQKLIEQGKRPTDYDWWQVEQVKNVSAEKTEHPCQVPTEIITKLICATTNAGDTVLDPFLGSGTTALAARNAGRKCIGIERDERYCQISIERLKQMTLAF